MGKACWKSGRSYLILCILIILAQMHKCNKVMQQ